MASRSGVRSSTPRSLRELVDVPPADDDRDAIELDRRRHDEAVEVDLALDQAAVLVGRGAKGDVDRGERLLGLGDLVGDAGRWVEPDTGLPDVVRVDGLLDDAPEPVRRRPALERHGASVTDRDPDRRLEG